MLRALMNFGRLFILQSDQMGLVAVIFPPSMQFSEQDWFNYINYVFYASMASILSAFSFLPLFRSILLSSARVCQAETSWAFRQQKDSETGKEWKGIENMILLASSP